MIGSFIGTFVATTLFMELLEKHDSSLVSALTYTTPMFVFLLAVVILQEKLDLIKAFGIFITVIGIVIISCRSPE
jgi:drug/metabolite transporter (DMT)-like permease